MEPKRSMTKEELKALQEMIIKQMQELNRLQELYESVTGRRFCGVRGK